MTIGRQLLLFLSATWLTTIILIATIGFIDRSGQSEQMIAEVEALLVKERAGSLEHYFEDLPSAHNSAQLAFEYWYEQMSAEDVETRFEAAFEDHGDGTWRSRDMLFEGGTDPHFGLVDGIGAYVAPGELTAERKRTLVAAVSAVLHVAPGQRHSLESLWFATPLNDVVIFAPHRVDRLAYYRDDAPPDAPFSQAPFIQDVWPENNPDKVSICGGLGRALWDPTGQSLVSSCQTPSYFGNSYIGAWGTTLLVGNRLAEAVASTEEGRHILLASMDNQLIAGTGSNILDMMTVEEINSLSDRFLWDDIQSLVGNEAEPQSILDADLPWIISYVAIPGPEWKLIYLRDRAAIASRLYENIPALVIVGILLLVAHVGAVMVFVQHQVQTPLREIAERYANGPAFSGESLTPKPRLSVEIKNLENQLAQAWAQIGRLVENLEFRVQERTRDLQSARDKAESATRAKDLFLANMSHEVRTPLNGVIAVANLLAKSDLNDKQREMVGLIRTAGDSLERILSDILDVSKIEAGKLDLIEAPFEIKEAVESAARAFEILAVQKGVSFSIDYTGDENTTVLGDAVRFRQIISNLVSNAVKFTDEGDVNIAVSVDASPNDTTRVSITVEDTGIGFDDETAQRLFSRFEQGEHLTAAPIEGTGLGLSIARSLADLMGGSITAQSDPGKHTTFIADLPFKSVQSQADLQSASGQSISFDPSALRSKSNDALRLLIAEDHPSNRRVIELILDQIGACVLFVNDGREAVSAFKAGEYDAVLMDKQMPELDGLGATRAIRAFETSKGSQRTPILMVSATALPEHIQQAKDAGCDAHLTKPFTPESLLNAVASVLDKSEMA